jgi:hypothetical protein
MGTNRYFKLLFTFVTGIIFLMCNASLVSAQIIINELHPAPSTGSEWIELYNTADTAITLAGWKLEDQVTTPSTIFSFTTEILAPHSYLVTEINNKLNNSGDGVTLRDQNNQTIDQTSYTSSQTNKSWSRVPNENGSFVLSDPTQDAANSAPPSPQPSPSTSPTPTATPTPTPPPSPHPSPILSPTPTPASSSTPTPLPQPSASPPVQPSPLPSPTPTYPSNLKISEIMACPETGDHEWVEVYNPDPVSYTLQNWKLRDSTSNTRLINGPLPAQSFTVFTLSSNILNNDGDELNLERPDGTQVDHAEFTACTKGRSFIFYHSEWQETTSITEGSANIYTPLLTLTDGDISDWADDLTQETETDSSTTPSESKKTTTKPKKTPAPKTPKAKKATTSSEASSSPLTDLNLPQSPPQSFFSAHFFTKLPQFEKLRNAAALLFASSALCLGISAANFRRWYQWYTESHVQNDFTFS